ncbi:MAG: response regulator [Anaerolineaceae bacterium]|nr:response regulator [Anaerolineaceae bacterium]
MSEEVLVLVLDTELKNRIIELFSFLSSSGLGAIHVQRADSAEMALEMLQVTNITLVILGLPISSTFGDGLNLLLKMRQLKPFIPIVVLVNQDTMGIGVQALELGAFAYLPRQYLTAETLHQVIHNAAEKNRDFQTDIKLSSLEAELFNAFPVCVAVLNDAAVVTAVNQEWHLLAGITEDPLVTQTQVGINFLQLCQEIDRSDVAGVIQSALAGYKTKEGLEYSWKESDGTLLLWRKINATPLKWPKGGVILSLQEVTELVNSQIHLATYEAQISDLKSNFSTLVHDLRSPLTSLNLYLDLLKSGNSANLERYVRVMKQEVIHMDQLVNDMLTLTRIEEFKDVQYTPINLADLVEQVVLIEKPVADSKGLTLDFTYEKGPFWVMGQSQQLLRVITNLVANGLRYTLTGGVKITLERNTAPEHIILTITDTGIGIAPEVLPFIFEPFFRSARAQNISPKGTGLGLSIVKRIVTMHEGTVEVFSELNKGTAFRIVLPGIKT